MFKLHQKTDYHCRLQRLHVFVGINRGKCGAKADYTISLVEYLTKMYLTVLPALIQNEDF